MGRELKRVPLNFAWPITEIWSGYLNPWYDKPHHDQCPHCQGSGATSGSQRLDDLINLLMLSGSDAGRALSHPYFDRMEGLHHSQGKIPSVDLADLTARLAGRKPSGFGHDCIDKWSARAKILAAAKLPKKWGDCPLCKGTGDFWHTAEARVKAARWRRKEPPKGVGYQIWETVTEGSPISPVFAKPEDLAEWMSHNQRGVDVGTTKDQWLKFILGPGWAPSFIGSSQGLQTGVQTVT